LPDLGLVNLRYALLISGGRQL